jgi:hypothetical protein
MSTSAALDPGFVLWSIPEPEWPGRPLIVLLRGWSQNPDQLLCPQVARPPLKNQGVGTRFTRCKEACRE